MYIINTAAVDVIRFAKYMECLECPAISLLRIVPSLYSVPIKIEITTAATKGSVMVPEKIISSEESW